LKYSFKASAGYDRFHSYMQLKLQTYVWEKCQIIKFLLFYNCDDWKERIKWNLENVTEF
jgi:hypothetical protein